MNKLEAIKAAKIFRQKLDTILQEMKEHAKALKAPVGMERKTISEGVRAYVPLPDQPDYPEQVQDQHGFSIHDLESAIMRQGMALKYIGNPDPYPESRDPSSPVVAPTADGLKL